MSIKKKLIIVIYIVAILAGVFIMILNGSNYTDQYIYNKVYNPENYAFNSIATLGTIGYTGNSNYSVQYILNKVFDPTNKALKLIVDSAFISGITGYNADTARVLKTANTTAFNGITQPEGSNNINFVMNDTIVAYIDPANKFNINNAVIDTLFANNGRMNYIELNPNKNNVTSSNIDFDYPAIVDNFDSLNTTYWTLKSPAEITGGNLVLSGNGGGIVSQNASSATTYKWTFSHLKLTDYRNFVYFGFSTENAVNETTPIIKIIGNKTLQIFTNNSDSVAWSNVYSNANDIKSIICKKVATDSFDVYVNDTFRVGVDYNYITHNHSAIEAYLDNVNGTNDTIMVTSYESSTNYSKATFSYDYNNNNFLAMLDADTLGMFELNGSRIPVINSDSINTNKAVIDTLNSTIFSIGSVFHTSSDSLIADTNAVIDFSDASSIVLPSGDYMFDVLYPTQPHFGELGKPDTSYANGYIDTLTSDSVNARVGEFARVGADTLTAGSVNARTAVVNDTLIIGDQKIYFFENYIQIEHLTGWIHMGVKAQYIEFVNYIDHPLKLSCTNDLSDSITALLINHNNDTIFVLDSFDLMHFRTPTQIDTLESKQIQFIGNDSLISVALGRNGDTIWTVDSFNVMKVYAEVGARKPGVFLFQDSNVVATTFAAQSTWYTIVNWSLFDNDSVDVDVLGDSAIVFHRGGWYSFNSSISGYVGTSGDTYDMGVFINDTLYSHALMMQRYFGGTQTGNFGMGGNLHLNAGDTVKVRVRDNTGTKDLTAIYGQLKIKGE